MSGSAGELVQQEDLGTAGTFRTALLHTHDVATAARFYSAVFGWEVRDTSAPSFSLNGQRVAGLRLTAEENLWVPYVAVEDVAASSHAAVQAGATVIRAGVLSDPEGAIFGLCTDDEDVALTDGAGSIWWVEVLSESPSALQKFYTRLFGWKVTEQPLAPHPLYVIWRRGDKAVAGLLPIGEGWEVAPRWQVLFQVDNLEISTGKVIASGGTAVFGPLDVPQAGLFMSVRDPGGALFVLAQPHSK